MNINNWEKSSTLIIPDVPSAYFLDTDAFDSLYISQRYILLAIDRFLKGEDVIITIYDNDETKGIFENYKKIFWESIDDMNVIWVPEDYYKTAEFLTWENINWEKYLSSHGHSTEFILEKCHFSVRKQIQRCKEESMSVLNIRWYKVTAEMLKLWENIRTQSIDVIISWESDTKKKHLQSWKAILHPSLSWDKLFHLSPEILQHIPHGRVVSESDGKLWLLRAIEEISALDSSLQRVLIKPLNASSWEGIIFIDISKKDDELDWYKFEYGDVVVEQCLDLLELSELWIEWYWNDPMSLSVQYYDGEISGEPVVQLTKDNEFQWNIILSKNDIKDIGLPKELFRQVKEYSLKLIQELWLEWNWGFDFLFDKHGKFYFIDPNIGRDTWALPLRLFERIFLDESDAQTTIFSKINAENIFDLDKFITALEEKNFPMISKENTQGVLTVSFVAWEHLTLIISGESYVQVDELLLQVKELVSQGDIWKRKSTNRSIKTAGENKDYDRIHEDIRG